MTAGEIAVRVQNVHVLYARDGAQAVDNWWCVGVRSQFALQVERRALRLVADDADDFGMLILHEGFHARLLVDRHHRLFEFLDYFEDDLPGIEDGSRDAGVGPHGVLRLYLEGG